MTVLGPCMNLQDPVAPTAQAEALKDVLLALGWRSKVFFMPFP